MHICTVIIHVQMIFFILFFSPRQVALSSVFFFTTKQEKDEWSHVDSGLFYIIKN